MFHVRESNNKRMMMNKFHADLVIIVWRRYVFNKNIIEIFFSFFYNTKITSFPTYIV